MITIKEMARIAGVSPTTVANVLHGRFGKVSRDKRERIEAIIEKSNYRLRTDKRGSRIIAVIFSYKQSDSSSIFQDSFASSLIGAMEEEIQKMGYFMMLYANTDKEECYNMAIAWNVDGIIFLGADRKTLYEFQSRLDIPITTIDTYFRKEDDAYVNIGLKDFDGGRKMADYLKRMGHQRILFLAEHMEAGRISGEILSGHEPDFRYGEIDEQRFQGAKSTGLLLLRFPLSVNLEEREHQIMELIEADFFGASALFFAADTYAIQAMNVLYDNGVSVPEQISVAGFDDTPVSTQIRPKLTTVKQDIAMKGKLAVKETVKSIKSRELRTVDIKLDVDPVIRDSVLRIRSDEQGKP